MRAARTLAVAATALAAVGLAAPLATATNGPSNVTINQFQPERGGDGSNGVTVSPFAVHQGGILTITVRGCAGGTVTSNAFATVTLGPAVNGVSTATARIFDNATPGQYNLAVQCNGRTLTQPFRVIAGQGAAGGLGGSMAPSSTEMAVGGGLVAAAALGGGLFIVRRRRVTGAGV
ncbi:MULTISPECIES: hypothetical protein [Streptomyces]|jgi:hypothetical protein|uniref:Integral membrane protein n=1 Tax=Streptomyces nymphaeiformis TaxID=2663842 RepID=A0A7W7U8G4_9ACTN|nr:hypothetical protein [Streptomyces nymphaeiformis]MBB4986901.1 hypothetical protein [Streptomyces nymphaeiformis]